MRPIDADAVIKKLIDISTGKDRFGRGIKVGISNAILRLENATTLTLDALRPKGRWLHHENGVAYCSECEMDAVEDGTNFCPNCGADMRGGGEDA